MKFYVLLTAENQIKDIVTYFYEGYIEVELEVPLPYDILAGVYELKENKLIYREDWVITEEEKMSTE